MIRLETLLAIAAATTLATSLGACSGSGGSPSSSLITGSLFSSAPKTKAAADGAPAVKPEDPMARPVHVAWTSARAAKCGFYFDPAKLRSQFLAAQATGGMSAEQMPKVQQTYDASYARISKALADKGDYCTSGEVADIKSDLNRHLAGDFTTQQKVVKAEPGMWEWLTDGGQKADSGQLDRNAIFFPSGGSQTTTPR